MTDIIQHPNGSDGWLPAEAFNSPPSSVKQESNGVARRSTISTSPRKSAVHSRTPSRHASTTAHPIEEKQVPAVVNGGEAPAPAITTAPAVTDEELQNRAVSADNNLTPKQRSKIAKSEAKDGRRISKIIKQEGRTAKQALDISINELQELQKFQNSAVKTEAHAHANHSKSLFAFKKTEAAYLNAKMRHETAIAELSAEVDALETLKNNSKEAAEKVQEKATEVEGLRTSLAVDERERELRLSNLKGPTVHGAPTKRSGSLWR
ncbi:hypothetical protein BYT27DRAFT_6761869 [Phlegmacium glaucopus]|nr:hypothetical protein BYT27DRAFT_6761869 [Phlegmacium glaucopus]